MEFKPSKLGRENMRGTEQVKRQRIQQSHCDEGLLVTAFQEQ